MSPEFELVSGAPRIMAILDAQVDGPYRFVHHALIPYVRIGPAKETDRITIRSGDALELLQKAHPSKSLQGLGATMDFAIMLEGVTGVSLREVPWRAAALDQIDPVRREALPTAERGSRPKAPRRRPTPTVPWTPQEIRFDGVSAQEQPEGGMQVKPPVGPRPKAARLVVPTPAARDVTIPEHLRKLCEQEDIHPELDDYLVIPANQVKGYQPLPAWVAVTEHVDQVFVVKPRLSVNRPIGAST